LQKCECNQNVELLSFVKGKISVVNARDVQISIEREWLCVLVQMPTKDFLGTQRKEQIKILSQFKLYGKFSLILTLYLAGCKEYHFEEEDFKNSYLSQSSLVKHSLIFKASVTHASVNLKSTMPIEHTRLVVKKKSNEKQECTKRTKKYNICMSIYVNK